MRGEAEKRLKDDEGEGRKAEGDDLFL